MINREAISVALFEKLSNIPGIKKSSRRLKHWSDVAPAECPALFLSSLNNTPTQKKGLPTVWSLSFQIAVYVKVPTNPNAVPQTALNGLLDAIELMFKPDPVTGFQTLDIPDVSHAWMSGTIDTDEGVLGDTAIAFIPIDVLASS